jgi:hypothetical protein
MLNGIELLRRQQFFQSRPVKPNHRFTVDHGHGRRTKTKPDKFSKSRMIALDVSNCMGNISL